MTNMDDTNTNDNNNEVEQQNTPNWKKHRPQHNDAKPKNAHSQLQLHSETRNPKPPKTVNPKPPHIIGLAENSESLSSLERKKLRAEKFGVSLKLSEEEKRTLRSARFGGSMATSKGDERSEEEKRKARAERFGLSKSSSLDEAAKRKARAARFGLKFEEEKKQERVLRFRRQSTRDTANDNNRPKTHSLGPA